MSAYCSGKLISYLYSLDPATHIFGTDISKDDMGIIVTTIDLLIVFGVALSLGFINYL